MDKQKQAFRVGSLSILLAVLLRIVCSNALADTVSLFAQPRLASFLVYTETGRDTPVTTSAPTTAPTTTRTTEPPIQWEPEPEHNLLPTEKAVFTSEDMQYLTLKIDCRRDPDEQALLTQPLDWDLTGDEPKILIIHTHGTEAFTPTEDTGYEEIGGEFRTADDRYNMISVGEELKRLLEEAGLSVIHDRTPYDLDDYLDAYDNSREAVKQHLQEHPSIELVLDLHRDAAEYADGTPWGPVGTVDGQDAAKVMLVVGTNAMGDHHPNWEQNLSTAEKLNVLMERCHAGMARNLNLRAKRYNQDLHPASIIAEIGAAGNSHEEAIRGVAVLADAIIQLALGSQ